MLPKLCSFCEDKSILGCFPQKEARFVMLKNPFVLEEKASKR